MAIMKNIVIAAAVLASSVVAAPVAALDDRAIHIDTVTHTAWVTIGQTATVWINDADPTTPSAVTVTASETATTTSVALITSTSTPTPSPSPAPAPALEPAPAPAPAPAPEPVVPAPQPAAPAPEAAAPVVSPAGFVASESATTQAPAPPTSAAAPPPASTTPAITSKDTAASSSATCEGKGNACVGDVTHWDGGLGACGWNVDSNSDLSIALPVGFMGAQSNGNPYCGRSLTIYNPTTGKTVQATVGDKCMGCVDRAIDLTNALFNAIVPGGDGRVKGIEWWFN